VTDLHVVVLGDVMLDVVVKPETDVAPTSDTPSRVRMGRGGSAANIAEAIARAGHFVTYVGACGSDLAAQLFEDALRNIGVDVALQRIDIPTGVVVAIVDGEGQRAMMTDRGANSALGLRHVLEQLDEPFDHLHVSGYVVLDSMTTDVGRRALARANQLGHSTSVDVCSVAPLLALTPAAFLAATQGARFLFANEEESLALSGEADVSSAIDRLARDFEEVVITRGDHGALARRDGVDFHAASMSNVVVDTTGAGDAAAGAYLAVRLRDGTVDQALGAAMTAAADVVKGLGSRGQLQA
jgi:ribokinase